MDDLDVGDFLYQSDQELFLVVTGVEDNHYTFAVHGWRSIDKQRVEGYIDGDNTNIYSSDEIESLIRDKGGEDTIESFEGLKDLFDVYNNDITIAENGPQSDFELDERS